MAVKTVAQGNILTNFTVYEELMIHGEEREHYRFIIKNMSKWNSYLNAGHLSFVGRQMVKV